MDSNSNNSKELDQLIHDLVHLKSADDIYGKIVSHIVGCIPSDRASMTLLNSDGDKLEVKSITGLGSKNFSTNSPLPSTLPGSAINAAISIGRARIWSPLIEQHHQESSIMLEFGFISVINVPILSGDKVIGCINSGSMTTEYTTEHVQILERVAAIITSSVDKLRHLAISTANADRQRIYAEHLEYLNEIGEELSKVDSPQKALEAVAAGASQLVNATRVSYCVLSPTGDSAHIVGLVGETTDTEGTTISLDSSGLGDTLISGNISYQDNLINSPNEARRRLGESGLNFLWSFPVSDHGSIRGALNFGTVGFDLYPEDASSVLLTLSRLLSNTLARISAQDNTRHALESLIDDCPLMLCLLDETGRMIKVSRFGSEVFGYDGSTLTDQCFSELHPNSHKLEVVNRLNNWNSMLPGQVDTLDTLMLTNHEETHWTRQTVRKTADQNGVPQLLIVCEDIHDLKAMARKLEHQAKSDALTGLLNRPEFNDRLSKRLEHAENNESEFIVMFFDLDNFKITNDTLGHLIGDEVLKTIAERLEASLEPTDLVARIGGDEFLIMLVNEPGLALEHRVQKLINTVALPIRIDSHDVHLSTSVGISMFPKDGDSVDELVKHADNAMYKAKELGKNQFCFYTAELSEKLEMHIRIEQELRHAIANDELSLAFQPQINLETGDVECLEVLIRWIHKTDGFIPPDLFIPVAESSGLIPEVTDWVLKNSLQALKRIRSYAPDMKVAVNVSALEFSGKFSLAERVFNAIDKSGMPTSALELELTETALLKNPQRASDLAHTLSDAGIRLAVDDFGTGYSSMSFLVHLPIDAIKIDRSFVDKINSDKRKQAVVAGLVAISKSLDVRCIGEGVETIGQLEWLSDQGCGHAQGYLFSKPVPEEQLAETLGELSSLHQEIVKVA